MLFERLFYLQVHSGIQYLRVSTVGCYSFVIFGSLQIWGPETKFVAFGLQMMDLATWFWCQTVGLSPQIIPDSRCPGI